MRNFLLNVVLLLAAIFAVHSCGQSNKDKYADRPELTESANNLNASPAAQVTQEGDVELIRHLTSAEFREMIYDYHAGNTWKYIGSEPAIIDFYADWCRPCKMMEPTLKAVAKEYNGRVKVFKVDTEAERDVAAKLQISSLPSILFIPGNGDQPQMAQGALSKASFNQMIKEYLLVD